MCCLEKSIEDNMECWLNVPRQTHCRLITLLSDSAPLAVQLKARFIKFMCKALEHDNPVVKYVAKVSCLNPMSVSRRNWGDCVTIQNEVSIVDMNVKNVYKEEWYDSVSGYEIDSAFVVKEMIDERDGSNKCEIFNIDDVEFIINDLCIN